MAKCEPTPLPDLPETFWAYLAAFIDGEGSVSMCQNGPRLIISNTDLSVLEWIKNSLGAGYIQVLQRKGRLSVKPCYNLTFGSNPIRTILPRVIPYMRIKRRRAELLIEYLSAVVPRGGSGYNQNFDELRERVKQEMLTS